MVAHANIWPRSFLLQDSSNLINVALVGNVATDPAHQKKGYSSALMQFLTEMATQQNLAALLLWSDLHQFYQKLGFTSWSKELRHTFSRAKLSDLQKNRSITIQQRTTTDLSHSDYRAFLDFRKNTAITLQRSIDEFVTLTTIPHTYLFSIHRNNECVGYFVIGKGADMQGVIHEWGVTDTPETLAIAIAKLLEWSGYSDVILIAPATLTRNWETHLRGYATQTQEHPVALIKWLADKEKSPEARSIAQGFIWGLDSI
jgi:hypothetical protein